MVLIGYSRSKILITALIVFSSSLIHVTHPSDGRSIQIALIALTPIRFLPHLYPLSLCGDSIKTETLNSLSKLSSGSDNEFLIKSVAEAISLIEK